jgi:hypothetical protein
VLLPIRKRLYVWANQVEPAPPGAVQFSYYLHNHAEVPMPQYEFYCHACEKTFTKILTLVDYVSELSVATRC